MPDNKEEFTCSNCGSQVKGDDDFCPDCGTLFRDDVYCINHKNVKAAGACIICCEPFCKNCGLFVNDIRFLCDEHSNYEIYEGMARIFGSSDSMEVEFYKDSLEKDGFHPIIYSRKASPISLGSPDYSLFRASGEFDGHIINEYKLMVPCQEVIEAEKFLKELG